jgi:hypothetical protein
MLATVELDDQPCIAADKVGDVAIDWDLTLELPAIKPAIAQAQPEYALDIGLMPPQTPRALDSAVSSIHDRSSNEFL